MLVCKTGNISSYDSGLLDGDLSPIVQPIDSKIKSWNKLWLDPCSGFEKWTFKINRGGGVCLLYSS